MWTPPLLFPPRFITTPELPDTRKSLISVSRGMREDCDIMAGAPGRLVPVNLLVEEGGVGRGGGRDSGLSSGRRP